MYTVLKIGPSWWIVETPNGTAPPKRRMGPFASQTRAAGICSGPLYNALSDLSR